MYRNPFDEHYDVAVIGGGLCGIAAALSTAMEGKKVIVIEERSATCWEVTWANELSFEMAQANAVRAGEKFKVLETVEQRLKSVGGLHNGRIDAPVTEILIDKLLDEAGVDVLLFSFPEGLLSDGELALSVSVGFKGGRGAIKAFVFVDATEDGILWRQAGAQFGGLSGRKGKQVVAFNHVGSKISETLATSCPSELGITEMVLKPSVWEGEAFLEFTVDSLSPVDSRLKLVTAIEHARNSFDILSGALVTHTGHELMPIDVPWCNYDGEHIHPLMHNLIGAGLWACKDDSARRVANGVVGRLAWGELAGKVASQVADKIKHSDDADKWMERLKNAKPSFQPSQERTDIVIAGGGTAGAIAAIAAGRRNAKVMLLEWGTILGGMGTAGGIHTYYYGVKGGLQDEVDERVDALSKVFAGEKGFVGFHPEAKKFVLTDMAVSAGVELRLRTVVVGALVEPYGDRKRINAVEIVGANGCSTVYAHSFIDCTGDGDLAAIAGAEFVLGREADLMLHAYSQPAGVIDEHGRLSFLNFDAGYVDPTDVVDMTRARRTSIRYYWREKFTCKERLLYIAPLLGVRQGRHIIGDYQLTLFDETVGRKFDDAVSYTWANYDNHSFDYENESYEAIFWTWVLGQWGKPIGCEVPYRCMLPRGIDGLIVACRALSVTVDAHHEFRMMRDMQRLGEVAAIAASIALKKGTTVREVDIGELQSELRRCGLLSDDEVIKCPLSLSLPEQFRRSPDEAIKAPSEELLKECEAAISSEKPEDAFWLLAHNGERAMDILLTALSSQSEKIRFYAASALAMLGYDDGAQELIECVRQRRGMLHRGSKAAPMWLSAILMLGKLKCKAGVKAIIEVLNDKDASLDALIASVRALGRIGDASVCDALLSLAEREDLPTQRQLQVSIGMLPPVTEDARWQIDLAIAEALAMLGRPSPQLAMKHINDERAHVRRLALHVLRMCEGVNEHEPKL
ncbi:MAG: hypothetical protein RUDDFDWM_001967 [Candidatus Fervidibacterota bacterium]